MSIKHILVPLEGQTSDFYVLETAFKVAKIFESHIEVLQVLLDGRDAIPFIGQGLSAPVVEQIIHSLEVESKEARDRAHKAFVDWLPRHADIPLLKEGEVCPLAGASVRWIEMAGRSSEIVPQRGRISDLVVLSRITSTSDDVSIAMTESTLMESGCPVLFAVQDIPQNFGENVTIFWNGSLEAARAVHLALPFLKKAKNLAILTTSQVDTMGENGEGLKSYLSCHGIVAQIIDLDCDRDRIGEALLSESYNIQANLFIMGAYSHSRLRQWVLGSITKHVLAETSIPTLFIH